jgi:hypothetical protein
MGNHDCSYLSYRGKSYFLTCNGTAIVSSTSHYVYSHSVEHDRYRILKSWHLWWTEAKCVGDRDSLQISVFWKLFLSTAYQCSWLLEDTLPHLVFIQNFLILHCLNAYNYSGQILSTKWHCCLEVDLDMNHLLEVSQDISYSPTLR